MGVYTKHYIRILEDSENTPENRKKLLKIISENNEYDWEEMFKEIPETNGILSDEHINFGSGPKWYNYDNDIEKISDEFGDIEFYVLCNMEDGQYVYEQCYNSGYQTYVNTIEGETSPDIANNYADRLKKQ